MGVFTCCIWAFQLQSTPQTVVLTALAGLLPQFVGRWLDGRVGDRPAMAAAALGLLLCAGAAVIRSRFSEVEPGQLMLLALAVSTSEMLMGLSDGMLEQRLLPEHLRAAARRVRSYTLNVAGTIAPAVVGILMSGSPYSSAGGVSTIVLILGAALSLTTSAIALRHPKADASPAAERDRAGTLNPDVSLACFLLNFCMAMTHGALLMPMLLFRTSVNALAGAISCFFLGMSLGQLFEPLRELHASQRQGYSRNTAGALLFLALLFGMARTGWQWNLCAALGGVLLAAGWGNLEQMGVRHHRALRRRKLLAWVIGLPLGVYCGNALEWIMEHFPVIRSICARLTGLGVGSGMAMTFIVAGFLSLVALYIGNRLLNRRD